MTWSFQTQACVFLAFSLVVAQAPIEALEAILSDLRSRHIASSSPAAYATLVYRSTWIDKQQFRPRYDAILPSLRCYELYIY